MEKVLCVFAHPDDEAFGPGGTIAKLALTQDVFLVCATLGEAGQGKYKNLGNVRKKELVKSSKLLGVKAVYFLSYKDGSLSNNFYHKLVVDVNKFIEKLKPDTLLTFDPNGVTGHIDHVTLSLATTYVFEHQKIAKKLMYFCYHKSYTDYFKVIKLDYFIHIPPGYADNQIDEIVDVSEVWEKRIKAIWAHKSQNKDAEFAFKMVTTLPKKEFFRNLNHD